MADVWRYAVVFKSDQATAEKLIKMIEDNALLSYRRRCPVHKFLLVKECEKIEKKDLQNGKDLEL